MCGGMAVGGVGGWVVSMCMFLYVTVLWLCIYNILT